MSTKDIGVKMDRKLKILVITRSAWSNNNSTGNTLTNIFQNWNKTDFANLYCRAEKPKNNVCSYYYSITDLQLIKNLINPKKTVGEAFTKEINKNEKEKTDHELKIEKKAYNFFRLYRLTLFLWIQEIVWLFGRWRNKKLDNFLNGFSPDIIFSPVFQPMYTNRLLRYVKKVTKAKVILFHTDDHLTLKQFSLSPLFWINRIVCRHFIKKSIKLADINYCISNKQIHEYTKIQNSVYKILYKFSDFSSAPQLKNNISYPLKLVYTGNVNLGRWKSLGMIGEALSRINSNKIEAQLYIYTASPLTRRMKRALSDNRNIFFMGAIPAGEVIHVQTEADVLVHAESLALKESLAVRLSFSTKIVDYLARARCILAVGSKDCASIEYIKQNDAGLVASTNNDIYNILLQIVNDTKFLYKYASNAYKCGRTNHQTDCIKNTMYTDLVSITQSTSKCL